MVKIIVGYEDPILRGTGCLCMAYLRQKWLGIKFVCNVLFKIDGHSVVHLKKVQKIESGGMF
jgi:hypothetical protein